MSKIKTSKVEPRTPQGTLVLGSEDGTVMFEGTVVVPQQETTKTSHIDSGNEAMIIIVGDKNMVRVSSKTVTLYGALIMGHNPINYVADPEYDDDAATKGYVDRMIAEAKL